MSSFFQADVCYSNNGQADIPRKYDLYTSASEDEAEVQPSTLLSTQTKPYSLLNSGFSFDSNTSGSNASSSTFGFLPQWLERDLDLAEPPYLDHDKTVKMPQNAQYEPSMTNTIEEKDSEIQKLKQKLDLATRKIQNLQINGCREDPLYTKSVETLQQPSSSLILDQPLPVKDSQNCVEPTCFTQNLMNPWNNKPSYLQSKPRPFMDRTNLWENQSKPLPQIQPQQLQQFLPPYPSNPLRPEFDNSWIPIESAYRSTPFIPTAAATAASLAISSSPPSDKKQTSKLVNIIDDKEKNSTAIPVPIAGAAEVYYPIKSYNEPLNYRKLLERTVSCNWTFIVNRIVLDNDQQASIFLQQKLKVANQEQKSGIISAIIDQSYMLMINRFGNFLVQRCLEYGSPEQINSVTKGMTGNVITLAMDPFGCHVIQKALDCVNEEMRSMIIEEMLSKVTETVVHRYACHVWQKLFELRWDSSPPRFMQKVNQDLKGMWTQVALGETGSLVVQNIFENCIDEDKTPCVEEVVENLDAIIKGQWGNWVIQHMVEHASEPYRQTVIKQIINEAPTYSVDQFASKAVEKMLKMGDKTIIQMFLDKVTEKDSSRPRIPLIDIASDAHGNYLIQYILQSGTPTQKEEVATQIKKHMVSLRGSKWGSKCAWLIDKNRSSNAAFSSKKDPKLHHRSN